MRIAPSADGAGACGSAAGPAPHFLFLRRRENGPLGGPKEKNRGGRARRCGRDLEACAGCAGALRNREGASPHLSVRCCFRGGYRMASAPLSALLLQHGRAKRAVNRPLCAPCCCHSSPSLSPPLAAVGLVPPLRLALPGGSGSDSGRRNQWNTGDGNTGSAAARDSTGRSRSNRSCALRRTKAVRRGQRARKFQRDRVRAQRLDRKFPPQSLAGTPVS